MVKRLRLRISLWAMARPRLLTQLDEAARFPVTCFSSPVGSGKTTLLSQWMSLRDESTSWVTLDSADNSIGQVVATMVGAIHRELVTLFQHDGRFNDLVVLDEVGQSITGCTSEEATKAVEALAQWPLRSMAVSSSGTV